MPISKAVNSIDLVRIVVAGVIAGVLSTSVAYALFDSAPIATVLMNPQVQSAKLLKVWREIQPIPLVITNPPIMVGLYVILGVLHSFVYHKISGSLGRTRLTRGVQFGLIIWIFQFAFFEYFTPFNLFGEPAPLVALELGIWFVVAIVEGLAIALISRR